MTGIEAVATASATALVEVGETARWRWWGPRTDADHVPALADLRPPASFSLDRDQPLPLIPTAGGGWFGAPALVVHRGGRAIVPDLTVSSVERDADATTIRMHDAASGIAVAPRLERRVDAIVLSAEIVNTADEALDVE